MSAALLLLSLLLLAFCYLILLAASKHYWSIAVSKSTSALNINTCNLNTGKDPLIQRFGLIAIAVINKNWTENLKRDLLFLGRNPDELLNIYGLGLISTIICCACSLLSHSFHFLILFIVIISSLIIEIKLAVHNSENKIEQNLDHLVKCLKILIIKAEMPIITALEAINKDLEISELKKELHKIIERSQKSGLKKTLLEWNSKLPKFQDFIALLISIYEGASKTAIKENIENFLYKYQEEKNEAIKNESENLQLYLIIPVILMLITSMLPMIDAINFYMKNTGVL